MNYKVEFNPALEMLRAYIVFERGYPTHQEAEAALNAIADYTLLLHEQGLMPDYSNCGMVMEKRGDDWIEIDGDGNEI